MKYMDSNNCLKRLSAVQYLISNICLFVHIAVQCLIIFAYKTANLIRDYLLEQLKQEFGGRKSFTRQELLAFFRRFEPDLKESTFRWQVYNLKHKNIISPISRQKFVITDKPAFAVSTEKIDEKLTALIRKQFPHLRFAVWSTKAVNEFMLHQPARYYTLVEVEREATEAVFNFLKDNRVKNVFLEPNEKELQKYISDLENAVVVLPLVSKAPIQTKRDRASITIEKLLVDLYSDRQLFNAYQGSELVNIYNTAYNRYPIDFTKLFSYATRRRKAADLKHFLSQKTDIPQNLIYD
jgi:uncharacterized protein DUF6577